MRRAVAVPNVGDPDALIHLAEDVEAAGWDGFFVWDHVWDGVSCNISFDDLLPLRPDALEAYLGDVLRDPTSDVVTAPHPDHDAEEYEAIGVDWLVDTSWPGDGWLAQFRERLDLPTQPRP